MFPKKEPINELFSYPLVHSIVGFHAPKVMIHCLDASHLQTNDPQFHQIHIFERVSQKNSCGYRTIKTKVIKKSLFSLLQYPKLLREHIDSLFSSIDDMLNS